MMVNRVLSVNKKTIRLTDERWIHITDNHTEIAGLQQEVLETVYAPDFISKGLYGELYATKKFAHLGNYMIVVYREGEADGFIITAFRVRDIKPYMKKEMVWTRL